MSRCFKIKPIIKIETNRNEFLQEMALFGIFSEVHYYKNRHTSEVSGALDKAGRNIGTEILCENR